MHKQYPCILLHTYMILIFLSKGVNNIKVKIVVKSGGGLWMWSGRGTHKSQRY